MPIAMVVHKVMANQFHRESMGRASGPPMRTRPSGEQATIEAIITAQKLIILNNQSRRVRIKLLEKVASPRKRSKFTNPAITAAMRMMAGGQNTNGRTDLKNWITILLLHDE